MKISFLSKKPQKKEVAQLQFSDQKESFIFISGKGEKIVSIGLPDKTKMTIRGLHLLVKKIVKYCKENRVKRLYINFKDFKFEGLGLKKTELARIIAENLMIADYEFIRYKTDPRDYFMMKEIYIGGDLGQDIKKAFITGSLVAEAVNDCRDLVNTPGGELTPKDMLNRARSIARGHRKLKVNVIGPKKMERMGMGGVLGVAKGSSEDPQFIIMEYKGANKKQKPIVLVGKGITFDSGGVNLKPESALLGMHMDMGGAGAVMHTMQAARMLNIKQNIVALIPCAENMTSGSSYRPGDILKTFSGRTVEVKNTDAEGRLILADALTYAKKYKPRMVIDVATLTGASMVALGCRANALFSNRKSLQDKIMEVSDISGDYAWPMPLWEEFEKEIKSDMADICNIGKYPYGGLCTPAAFLHQFAKDYPWAHLDIAPRNILYPDEMLAKGASGTPLRMLLRLLENKK